MNWPWKKRIAPEVAVAVADQPQTFTQWLAACQPLADLPAGQYSAWWHEADDPLFSRSATSAAMDRAYKALPGVEASVTMLVVNACANDIPKGQPLPLPPPGVELVIGATTPGGPALLTFSQEKGIQWLFPRSTPRADREATWDGFAGLVEATRTFLELKNQIGPETSPIKPGDWWAYAQRQMRDSEARGETYDSFATRFHGLGIAPAVPVDALAGGGDKKRRLVEFPTQAMLQHHEKVMRNRMEGQNMLLNLLAE